MPMGTFPVVHDAICIITLLEAWQIASAVAEATARTSFKWLDESNTVYYRIIYGR